jgi:N,N-dimethylformamidase beta subunit-like, C-terminal
MIIVSTVLFIFLLLLLIPKYSTGRILYAESFVPELQVHRKLINRNLSNVPVKVEIVKRNLYKIKAFSFMKPIFELLPSSYSARPNKDGLFIFWAYPFDVVSIIVGEDQFRATYTLRHRLNDFWPNYANFVLAISTLIFPKLLHIECIEIPTTLGRTCGYSDKLSVFSGEEISLMISTRSEKISLELIRVGQKLKMIQKINDILGTYQSIETKFPSALGCGWKPSLKYKMPKAISGGCYLIKLTGSNADDSSFIPVIVKPEKIKNEIAVIASTNTWHAYNSWGGQNFYINYTSFPSKYILSTQRPFDLSIRNPVEDICQITRDHLLVGERFVWAWLERENYDYDLYSDIDLHSPEEFNSYIKKYKIIIISTHNEYWSYAMIDHLKEFIKSGGNVISLSGNTMFKEVTFPREDMIVLDGAYFREQGFKEETVLGIAHDIRGFKTWAPYKVMKSDHWVFSGTDLKDGDLLGKEGLNVSQEETTGASGWETDKIFQDSPKNTILLAKGINPGEGGADISLYQDPGGGSVFAVGSITFGGSLLVDDNISKITKNVVQRFLGSSIK